METGRETPWSIVVGVAGFLAQLMAGGLVGTSGFYYPYFQSAFQSSGAATSWLCSMTMVGWFVGNSIGSLLVNRFGYRVCALVGGVISSLGLSLCLVANNFYLAFLFYGVMGCIGNGIHGMAFLVAIITYFDKHRRSLQVLITVGSGVGFAVYSTLIPIVTSKVGWRGCLFLQGGVSLNICVLGMLLFKRTSGDHERPKKLSINVSLFFKLPVLMFCLHEFLVTCSETATFVHLPVLIISKGFLETDAAIAFLCYAICNATAKLTYSFPWKVNPYVLYTITVFVYGIAALCQPFMKSLIPIYICTGVSGFTANCFAGYTTVVILELAGKENYTDVHGIVYMFRALGSITIGPVAAHILRPMIIQVPVEDVRQGTSLPILGISIPGLLFDATQRYENVFFMIGGLVTTACILMIPILKGRRGIPSDVHLNEEEVETSKDLMPLE